MPAIVELAGVTKTYHLGVVEVPALRGVDLAVQPGEYIAIMGSSGSGKSTLLNLLGCLDRPSGGVYRLGGDDISRFTDDQLSEVRSRRIGFIFQSFNLIEQLSVLENIEVPLFYQGLAPHACQARCRQLAARVGLGDRVNHRPRELSGGQQQRVAIARALANDPLIILADEPTGNLDSSTEGEVLDLLDEFNRSGKTIIMVTHDDHVAARAHRIVVLKDGRVATERRREK